jgi:hypothetical protein
MPNEVCFVFDSKICKMSGVLAAASKGFDWKNE